MTLRDRKGYEIINPRIDEHGNVFDGHRYDTGVKVPLPGVPIRDSQGRQVPRGHVDSVGIVRDGQGRCVPGYAQLSPKDLNEAIRKGLEK